jgi:signal transduction histidine kinase
MSVAMDFLRDDQAAARTRGWVAEAPPRAPHPFAYWLPFGVLLLAGCMTVGLGILSGSPLALVLAALQIVLPLAAIYTLGQNRGSDGRTDQVLAETRRELEWLRQNQESIAGRLLEWRRAASLGILAPGVAHEINNAMSYVTSNVRMLASDIDALPEIPESLREYGKDLLPSTLAGIQRVNLLVDDLRRFAGGNDGQPAVFDVNAEVESAVRLLSGMVKHRCRIEPDLAKLPRCTGRPGQLRMALLELLLNASQAAARDGLIRVRTRLEDGEIAISVADDGPGMSRSIRERLFQPFFSTRSPAEASGLGLALAQRAIQAQGGRIDVESAPGRGSCFTVRLPKVSPEAAARSAQPFPPSVADPRPANSPAVTPAPDVNTSLGDDRLPDLVRRPLAAAVTAGGPSDHAGSKH